MADALSRPSESPASGARCPTCGKGVDPLRAGSVAIIGGRFEYFCDAGCKVARFRRPASTLSPDEIETAAPPAVEVIGFPPPSNGTNGTNGAHHVPVTEARVSSPEIVRSAPLVLPSMDAAPITERSRELARRPAAEDDVVSPTARSRASTREAVSGVAYAVGIGAAALVPALGLIESLAAAARAPLVCVAALALAVRAVVAPRDPSEPHPALALIAAFGTAGAALLATAEHDRRAPGLLVLAAVAIASVLIVDFAVDRARRPTVAARERVARALETKVRVLYGDEPVAVAARDVKPGEQVIVEAGEVVGVDAIVVAGTATVTPWLDAPIDTTKRDGDAIVAGARVVEGRLRLTTTWSGLDRAWAKLTLAPGSRIDVAAPYARATRLTIERGAPLVAALAGVAAFANGASRPEIGAAACAAALAVGGKGVAAIVALHHARAQARALGAGIVFKDARSFDRASDADCAVLCARGTVLMGEPEIVAIEALGSGSVGRVLSLAAGAETASTHPFASAILRAARARGERPDNVRNAAAHAGLGVTALASTGERLIVGSRALMLHEKVSVAAADARVTELEAQGRSVLLVASADRLVGLIALQDGLRAGARAAVQRLHDHGLEPVLLSGEARETCQSIAHAIDIEHVCPEILPADRGANVRKLADGGRVVAVVGHPATDDGALGAADVAIAMGAAGSTPGEWAVALASDDVRDAAQALGIARSASDKSRAAIALGVAPSALALIGIAFGAPLVVAPIAAVVGLIAALSYGRDA
jgi:cation transport ATPase